MLLSLLLLCTTPVAAAAPVFPAISIAPKDPIAYRSLTIAAKAAFDAKDYAKAETLYRQATDLYPLDWLNWRYLAASLRFQDKWREAIPAYERLIQLSGTFVGQGRYYQAVGYTKLGQRDKALATLKTMIFEDHAIDRPGLAADENFKPLWADPEFRALVSPPAIGKDRDAQWRGDLAFLVSEVHRLNPDYRGKALSAETQGLVDKLDRDIPKLSDDQIFARLSEVVGSLHQNHTMFWGASFGPPDPKIAVPMRYLPLHLWAFPEGIYVVGADEAHQSLIGSRVEAVGGVPIAEVVRRIRPTMSFRSEAEFAWSAPMRMTSVALLQGLDIAQRDAPVSIMLSRAGATSTINLKPVDTPVGRKLGPPPGVDPPRFLAQVPNPHWFELLPGKRTVYAQFNQVADGDDETLQQFGLKLRDALADPAIDSVIVDLRHNNGGNTFLYPELLRTLTAFSTRPGAQVYALIGRNVYSAAGNFVTDLERFASPVFVGEPTGNMGNQDGDEGQVLLPYSRFFATVAAVKWQLSFPGDDRATIVPHVPVPLTAADYFAGRDPVFDTAIKLIEARRRQGS